MVKELSDLYFANAKKKVNYIEKTFVRLEFLGTYSFRHWDADKLLNHFKENLPNIQAQPQTPIRDLYIKKYINNIENIERAIEEGRNSDAKRRIHYINFLERYHEKLRNAEKPTENIQEQRPDSRGNQE